eukprot:279443-Hanusia_phi.AAC.4
MFERHTVSDECVGYEMSEGHFKRRPAWGAGGLRGSSSSDLFDRAQEINGRGVQVDDYHGESSQGNQVEICIFNKTDHV